MIRASRAAPAAHGSTHASGSTDALADLGITPRMLADIARQSGLPTGAIVQNFLRTAPGTDLTALTSGTLYVSGGLVVPGGRSVASVTFVSGTTALAAGTHLWAVLMDSARKVLAVTADDTSPTWSANSAKTFTFAAAYVPTSAIEVSAGVMAAAGTPPNLIGVTLTKAQLNNLGPIQAASSSTGQTTPPAVNDTMGALTGLGRAPYCYLS